MEPLASEMYRELKRKYVVSKTLNLLLLVVLAMSFLAGRIKL